MVHEPRVDQSKKPTYQTPVSSGADTSTFYGGFTTLNALYSHRTMDENESVQVVELRISYRYATVHPWVVQAIRGFLSAYFMESPGFRVQRYMEEIGRAHV